MVEGSELPALRAVLSQAVLDLVDRSEAATEILRRVDPTVVEEVRDVLPVAWLPMQLHMDISNAAWDVAGAEFVRKAHRVGMSETYRRPLLKNFLSMTTSLFGFTPIALFKRGDGIFRLVTRGLGSVTTSVGEPRSPELHLRGFPCRDFDFARFIEGLGGSIESVLDFCSVGGEVRVIGQNLAAGEASFKLTWR
jgi:hypothetical protein